MSQKTSSNRIFLFLSLLGVTGYFLPISPRSLRAEDQSVAEANKVVAQVNGKPIYEEQLKPEVESSLRKFRKYGMRKEPPDLAKRLRSRALDKLIGDELIDQESRKLKIEDVDEKVKQMLEDLEKKHPSREQFEKYLKRKNLTMEVLRSSLRARVYIDEYLKTQDILEPEISEELIKETYARDPDSYTRKETLQASHVLIAVDGSAGAEEKKQARKKAETIRKEILGGKDFAEMAEKHSDCNSASGGGRLGYIKKGYMPDEFDKVAFAMKQGAVSEVVKTKFGYHIIKVLEKKPAGVTPYEEVRDLIKKLLQQQESKKKLAVHITELKKKAKIEIYGMD
jgi:peptidyl-prolyl cis-trans isomerase C